MNATVSIRKPAFSIAAVQALAAIAAVFVLGGASGYAVRSLTAPAAPHPRVAAGESAVCPAGTHVAVWYSAGTWSCIGN